MDWSHLAVFAAAYLLRTLTPLGFFELALIVITIVSSVLTTYALVAARARRLFTSTRTVRLVNRGGSVIMAGAAISIAAR